MTGVAVGPAWGADAAPPAASPIVITATRTPQSLADIPQAVSLVGGEQIAHEQARTPNLMLAEVPGVWSSYNNVQGSPIIRGQIGNRVVYLWDGIRINNGAEFSGPNGFFNQFPIASVARIEVLRGPGAVQFGSDAIGGVVNVIGKQSNPFSARQGLSGDAGARLASVDGETTGWTDLTLTGDTAAGTFGLSGQHLGKYHAPGVGTIANAGFDNLGGHAGAAWHIDPRQTLSASLVADSRTDVQTYSQSKLNPSGVPRIFGPYERRWIAKLGYERSDLGRYSEHLQSYVYAQQYDASRLTTNEAATSVSVTTALTSQHIAGLGLQNTARLGAALLTLGADARFENLASSKLLATTNKATGAVVTVTPNGQVPDGTYDVLDAFALAQWALTRDLSLDAGARFEQVTLNSHPVAVDALAPFTVADLRLNRSWHAPTYSLGLLYRITPAWSLAGNVASGFRAPTYSDMLSTSVPVFATGIASVPSPGLGPEHSLSYEVSARWSAPAGWASATLYRMNLKDLITSVAQGTIDIPGVGVVTAQRGVNSGRGEVDGAELDAGVMLGAGLRAFASATYTHGVDQAAHVPLRFMPPFNGRVGLRAQGAGASWWAEAALRWAERLRHHAPQDQADVGFATDPARGSPNATTNPPYRAGYQIPGFAVLNLRGGLRLHAGSTPVDLSLALNNVLDVRYREAYAQQQLLAPGFGAVLSATLGF